LGNKRLKIASFFLKTKCFSVLIILLTPILIFSQTKNTYFQQEVNYNITVQLNDKTHELSGFETIEYTNNSKQSLNFIYFHLWPNAYKNHKTALGQQQLEDHNTLLYYAPENLRGYIDSLDFKSKENNLKWTLDSTNNDVCIVHLTEPLTPGETINITTPFHVKIPKGIFSRMGHIGESYQITQWFPKPAVFDKDGWHPMPYLDQGEFYSEFGTFDVFITLPKNYVVGATGDLINGENEIKWLNQKVKQTAGIEEFDYYDMEFPKSSDTLKTLHYHQKNIHDFAWFADKRYHILKGEIELPHSKRKITTWTMFTNNEAHLWKNSIEYLNDATYYYSLWNGDYPYNQITAVDGALSAGGGMEYPNVTVIGESYDAFTLETTIMHEVGHNWFYGILGSNERDYGWMDEGINSMNENRYIETKYPERGLMWSNKDSSSAYILEWFDLIQHKHKSSYYLSYLLNARRNKDQAINEHSAHHTSLNYGAIIYGKTALAFDYLKAYLGDELYDKCMQQYFNKWKFKHPNPKDLQTIFEVEVNKDLSWFFDDLIKTTKYIDYKISKAKTDKINPEKTILTIKNGGGINGPFSVSGIKSDSIIHTQWYSGFSKKETIMFKTGDYEKYKIDAQLDIPEISRKNNTLRSKGVFKSIEPLRLQWLGSIENPNKTQLFFTPIAGWNANDQGMIGMAFYNTTLPAKKLSYIVAPLYANTSKNINGYINTFYHIHPNNIFQEVKLGASASSFAYKRVRSSQNSSGREILEYYKITPSLKFSFKKKRERQFHSISLSFKNNNIMEEEQVWKRNIDGANSYNIKLQNFYINQAILKITNTHPINPFDISAEIQQANDFIKLNLTTNYHFAYRKKNTGFDIRLFGGKFLSNDNVDGRFNYQLDGNTDYLYEQIFLARTPTSATDGFLTQQFAVNDGGFKNRAIPQSESGFIIGNNWIGTINLKSNLITKHLSIYADYGMVSNNSSEKSNLAYNYGFALNIIPKIFEIYFPIKSSSKFNLLNYGEKIRFTLNLNTLNPFEKIRGIDL